MIIQSIYRANRLVQTLCTTIINRIILRLSGAELGKRFKTCGLILVRNFGSYRDIKIGDDVFINSSRAANPIGGDVKTIIFNGGGKIIIEDRVKISNAVFFSFKGIYVGKDTFIGGGVKIYDSDFHSLLPDERLNGNKNIPKAEVRIGKRCFIGGNSTILKGVSIGDEAVIGAASVVTKNIPAGEVWAGNPAKFIKKI